MKVIAIIFAVLICVYAVVSLISLVMKFVNAQKKRAEVLTAEAEPADDQDGEQSTKQEDKPTD